MLQVHTSDFTIPVLSRTACQASLQWPRPKLHAVFLLKQCVHRAAGEKPCTLLVINEQQGGRLCTLLFAAAAAAAAAAAVVVLHTVYLPGGMHVSGYVARTS